MQCFYRAGFRTFVAENALRSIFPLAGLLINLHIHGTNPQAFAAMDTLAFITVNPKQRKITHRLQKYRNGAKILAERAVILEHKSQRDSSNVVKHVSCKEHPEHDLFQVRDLHQE